MFNIPINEQGWGLFAQLLRNLLRSPIGGRAVTLFLLLIVMLLGVNGLNIVGSYVGRDFMTAITERDTAGYLLQALFYVAVFAALTVTAVLLRYAEESLGFLIRDWMTRRFVELYLQYPTYYRMNDAFLLSGGIEHPDQRIADDVRSFATTTLSFILMVLNGLFTVVAFSGVLWSISPTLFGVALLYAVVGSAMTVLLGKRLVDLNYNQLDKEAAFRSGLMHVREHAESVALLHRESRMLDRSSRLFDQVGGNFRKIILVNRNLGYFTTGYNYLIQVIPVLLAAPLFVEQNADFGVITQAALAFAMLVGAFSLIVTQFQSISSFAAVIQRLINLWYAIELAQTETLAAVDLTEQDDRLAYERLTLLSPNDGSILVKDLTVEIPAGSRVLVTAFDDGAKDALFKGTAGIADAGTGRVIRPKLDRILFLPERPYLPPGTLRDALILEPASVAVADSQLLAVLKSLGIEGIVARVGGLDAERDWETTLSVHEQHLVSLARILIAKPRFAVLDLRSADLAPDLTAAMLNSLAQAGIGYLTMGRDGREDVANRIECYDAFLEFKRGGEWNWEQLAAA
ncbi:MAG: ABC transporter ATP-binding protein/permease [Methylococcaceae bacterium]|nr:ABC transporter ATP-binding protein/permease [Methylococcaceae bacterium]